MDFIQDTLTFTLTKEAEKKLNELIAALLTKKLQRKGFNLNKRQLNRLVAQVKSGTPSTVHFRGEGSNVKLTITKGEVERIETRLERWWNRVLKKLPDIYRDSAYKTADEVLKTIVRQGRRQLEWMRSERDEFAKQLRKIWKRPFELYELYVSIIEEITIERYNEFLDHPQGDEIMFEILFRLQARAVQVAKEILVLMEAGFADGAHARWRSLHEIAVVGMFIDKHGKDVAERYLAHDAVDYFKGAELHQTNAKVLKRRVIPKRDMERYRKQRDKAIAKYGKNFKYPYGWASDALNNPKPNFDNIEADVGQGKWRHLYKQASWNVHANPGGITSRMGLMDEHQDLILMGGSIYGFTDAAHGSSIALMYLTSTLVNVEVNTDRMIHSLTLMNLSRLIGEEFSKVQDSFVAE